MNEGIEKAPWEKSGGGQWCRVPPGEPLADLPWLAASTYHDTQLLRESQCHFAPPLRGIHHGHNCRSIYLCSQYYNFPTRNLLKQLGLFWFKSRIVAILWNRKNLCLNAKILKLAETTSWNVLAQIALNCQNIALPESKKGWNSSVRIAAHYFLPPCHNSLINKCIVKEYFDKSAIEIFWRSHKK